jgi:hypothetical protein
MFGLTDLKAAIAASWKVFWNDEPAALSVPLPDAAADAVLDPVVEPVAAGVDELDEEQAARARAAMTAPPATAACLLPRSCI